MPTRADGLPRLLGTLTSGAVVRTHARTGREGALGAVLIQSTMRLRSSRNAEGRGGGGPRASSAGRRPRMSEHRTPHPRGPIGRSGGSAQDEIRTLTGPAPTDALVLTRALAEPNVAPWLAGAASRCSSVWRASPRASKSPGLPITRSCTCSCSRAVSGARGRNILLAARVASREHARDGSRR
jgi:hypothetical protein